jgi:hypothetical protein
VSLLGDIFALLVDIDVPENVSTHIIASVRSNLIAYVVNVPGILCTSSGAFDNHLSMPLRQLLVS